MRKIIGSVLAAACATLVAASANAAIVFTFTPSSQHVNIGDTVRIDATISGLGAEILSGADLNFLWTSPLMGSNFRSINGNSAFYQMGGAYGSDPTWQIDSTANGDWGIQFDATADDATIAANQADSFLFAQFAFSADADGATLFSLGTDTNSERKFLGLNGGVLDVTVGSACVAIGSGQCSNNVPEPGSLALLGLGLAGIVVARRRLFAA